MSMSRVVLVCWRLTTWVCVLAALWPVLLLHAALQDSDLLLLGQQQRTRPVKTLRDSIADGINGRALTRGAVEQFTILAHYDPSTQLLSAEQQRVLKTVLVGSAVDWLSNTLRARPMATPILFERLCMDTQYLVNGLRYCRESCLPHTHCGPVRVPTEHQALCRSCAKPGLQCEESGVGGGGGVEGGHFLLYISALDQPHCRQASLSSGLQLVQGEHCLQEQEYNRPVAGYLNFCPGSLSTAPSSLPRQQHAVMHQLMHTLAFSEELFPWYYDERGYPRTRRTAAGRPIPYLSGKISVSTNTVRLIHRRSWTTLTPDQERTVSMVVTPNVLREVRAHFGCESLEGAELEDQGMRGVAGRHWENRVFGEELMTGVSGSYHIISRVTLALLHDSGWYLPDYSYAGQLSWGRGKGCHFVMDSCGGWLKYQDGVTHTPFCDGRDYNNGRSGCVNDRTSVGPCLIHNYTLPLPQEYQYLSQRRGGTQILADYCPLYGTWQHGDDRVGHSCLDHTHNPAPHVNFALEEYGAGSRCFEQSVPLSRNVTSLNQFDEFKRVEGKRGGGCYKFVCSAGRVLVRVGDHTLRCGREGRRKWFEHIIAGVSYKGFVVCPSYTELCQAYDCVNRCSDHGTCHQGQCRCYHGYYGDDCSYTYASKLLSCTNVTCHNESVCTEEGGVWGCNCPPRLTGQYCERNVLPDPCRDVDCHGNGVCTRTNYGRDPKCSCYAGYKGRKCSLLSDLCAESGRECVNNGTCVTNTTQCACPPEFWGEQCQYRMNYCLPTNPCPGGHLCTHHNVTQNYSCSCPDGYTGINCSQLIVDYCSLSPCFNNATCVNSPQGYECLCLRGYKGRRCRNRDHPCNRSPCGVGGRCRILLDGPWGSVTCQCRSSYTGQYCELVT